MRQLVLVVLLVFLGFLAGGRIGASQAAADAGLAGGATVFLWASGTALVALVVGIMLAVRLSARAQWVTVLVATAFALLALWWMRSRIAGSLSGRLPGMSVAHAATPPRQPPSVFSDLDTLDRWVRARGV